MIIPIRTDLPLRSAPYVNYGLILVNVMVFALQKLSEGGALGFNFNAYSLSPGSPALQHFISYAFLHGGWIHLISNMLFLYIFGNNVCDRLGNLPYLAFYLAGGVVSGIGYVLTSQPFAVPDGSLVYAPVVGASGAIAAVTGAYLVLLPRSRVTVFYWLIIFGVIEVPGLLFVAFFFLRDVFFSFAGADTGVAYSAHIAGSVFGVVISLMLLWTRLIERDQFDLAALISRWNRRRQFRSAVRSGWDPYSSLPTSEPARGKRSWGLPGAAAERPPSREATRIMELRAEIHEAMAHRNLENAAVLYMQLRVIDAAQVLSRNAQCDIANQLAEMDKHRDAAEAYELFLRHYPDADQFAHIELLTGILYSRYLNDPAKALARIEHALPRLTNPREVELAGNEVARLRSVVTR
jgi:membrane associated rhomboid family serine protease